MTVFRNRHQLLFLDDAEQLNCARKGMNSLVAVGGISVALEQASELNAKIDEICVEDFEMPSGEPFKWSPRKNQWFKNGIEDFKKEQLFRRIFELLRDYDCFALTAICDPSAKSLTGAQSPEESALMVVLERFDVCLGKHSHGVVIVDRPPGNKADEEKYLADCLQLTEAGSLYANFERLACPIVTMPFRLSRILQVADLVVSITTAHFAGRRAAADFFDDIRPLFREDKWRIGGVGVKIHPDYKYANLYHWLLGDTHYVRGNVGHPMPIASRPYVNSSDEP